MHRIEIAEKEFDSFHIPMKELLCNRLRPLIEKVSLFKDPLSDFIYF